MHLTSRTLLTPAAVVGWVALASFAMSSPVAAQSATDSRWLPWLGCWRLVADVTQPALLLNPSGRREAGVRVEDDRLVCVVAESGGAAEIKTYADGELILQETLLPDGVPRPVNVSGCRGYQLTQWSRDGARLFFRSEMTCENQSRRSFSGVSFMRTGGTWVDIQALVSKAEREVVIRRYRPASAEVAAELGFESPSPGQATTVPLFDIEDFIEASEVIGSEALEAALMESGTTLELNRKALIELDDAGVSPHTIDLLVALAYPEEFEISRETSGRSGGSGGQYDDWNAFYFAPFGFYYWYTPYRSFFVHRPVVPDEGISGGKLVKGHGYTRVDPRDTASSAVRRGGSTTDSSSSTSSNSSGGSASSGGYSRGGSTSSRTAKPRDP